MKTLLNTDWLFHLGDEPGADFMGWDDRAWRRVTLPHDWSVEHPFDRAHASGTGYLPGGIAWYRKHFTLPESAAGQRVRLTFGGVYKHARVWVNSNYLGERAYGYSTFTYDVSDFVRPGENVISVRVSHEQVADSRWFTGSGIYRDVTLDIAGKHGFAVDGVFVAIGQLPENEPFRSVCEIAMNGYIEADERCTAGTPGVFVAGDCRQKQVRQITTATGDGAVAAVAACRYLDSL